MRGGGLKLVNIDTAVVAVTGPVDGAVLVPGDHVRVGAVHHLPLALHHQVGPDLEAVVAGLVGAEHSIIVNVANSSPVLRPSSGL